MYRQITIIVLLLACNVLYFSVQAQENVIDEVVWVVGDEPILKSEVEKIHHQLTMSGTPLKGDPYCVIPERVAIQKLYLHQAALDSVTVPDKMIYAYAEAQLNEYVAILGSKERVEREFGMSFADLRKDIIEITRENKIVETMQEKLTDDVKVTPSEVRRFFSDVSSDSIPYIPTQVEVQLIAYPPVILQEEIDNIKSRLRDYSDRVTKGEIDFSTLAILYSEDVTSARNGGELGFLDRSTLDPAFADVAFSLTDPKKVSKIVKSEFGYHIIQLVERRGDRVNVRHILIKPVAEQKEKEEALSKIDTLRSDILDGKISFEDAAMYISQDKQSRKNYGLMMNRNERTGVSSTRFQMDELPDDIAKVVSTLKEGEISKPFVYTSRVGQMVAIVKLKRRIDGHKANVSDDFQALKNIVLNRKKEEVIRRWLKEKQAKTYIRIKDTWKNCDFEHSGWVIQ